MTSDEKRDFEELVSQAMMEEIVHLVVNDKRARDYFFRRLSELMSVKTTLLGGKKV